MQTLCLLRGGIGRVSLLNITVRAHVWCHWCDGRLVSMQRWTWRIGHANMGTAAPPATVNLAKSFALCERAHSCLGCVLIYCFGALLSDQNVPLDQGCTILSLGLHVSLDFTCMSHHIQRKLLCIKCCNENSSPMYTCTLTSCTCFLIMLDF